MKFYTCRYDAAFKYVMGDEKSKDILKTILELILKIKIEEIEYLNIETVEESIKIKGKRLDLRILTDNKNINIEVNSCYKTYMHVRNMAYMCNLYERHILTGKIYNNKTEFIQINLTYGIPKKDTKIIRRYEMSDDDGKLFVNNFVIYEINMEKIMNFWYDNKKEEIEKFKYLIMLDLGEENLKKLSKTDKVVEKYMERLVRINENPEFQEYMSKEEDDKRIRNSELEEGIKTRTVEIVNNMLKHGDDINYISEITNLSVDEIKEIANS